MRSVAQSRVIRRIRVSAAAARSFVRTQIWVWPLLVAAGLALAGWYARSLVESEVKRGIGENLQTILDADVAALKIWLDSQEQAVSAIAADPQISRLVAELVAVGSKDSARPADLLAAPALARLRDALRPWSRAHGYDGFVAGDKNGLFVAADSDQAVGRADFAVPGGLHERVFGGEATVTRPFKSLTAIRGPDGRARAGRPVMFAVAPVRGGAGEVIAALAFRVRPGREFTQILSVASSGESGETYAFDSQGLLLSQSRFDDQLRAAGLLPDTDDARSIVNVEVRDPGVDMTAGGRPALRRRDQPLTRMAADATRGNAGVDVDGYRDYRGVTVVGAWTWLPGYGFGVATEIDAAEAFGPLVTLRRVFWALFGMLVSASLLILVFTVLVARARRAARAAELEARQLGQYALGEKLGEGGMGVVYKAHHALLRRPTAVKLLPPEKSDGRAVARFEREVRLTAQLRHPNTVAVYDFGRTAEGTFYYAMEYLDGIDLERLVVEHGPQPEGRVVHILAQVCGSLSEAHAAGLVHRDVKPANVMLTCLGGVPDAVKVLDFGLAKAFDAPDQRNITAAGAVTGTPLYMPPEAVDRPDEVDGRGDLYSVGAVGHFLLTGKPLFDGISIAKLLMDQVNTVPPTPSERAGRAVAADLEAVIMRCLAKDPAVRYATAASLRGELLRCGAAGWSEADARAWWGGRRPAETGPAARPAPDVTAEYYPPDAATTTET